MTQPLGTKPNDATYWDKKILQTLGTKKITQPLETKKLHQPLRTKKSANLLSEKSRNLSGQKMHTISRVKKATSQEKNLQPLGSKKSCGLSEQKKITQPLKTKKIMLLIGPIVSKLVHTALNCFK